MGDSLIRQWLVLSMLPNPPRRIDAGAIETRLRERGVAIHRRTIQRDLIELSQVFPIDADARSKPYGWRWSTASAIPGLPPRGSLTDAPPSAYDDRSMGQRGAHETVIAIIGAFVAQRRWTQAALAREAEVSTEALRKHLIKMKEDGWPLQEEREKVHVVWRMPPNWYPGVVAFKAEEVPDLLRLLARSPRSADRERVLQSLFARLPLKNAGPAFDVAVRAPELSEEEEQWVALFEDAAAKKIAVRMHYVTASRRDDATRHVSVHHVEVGAFPRFVATCHSSGRLKWFRVAGVSNARYDRAETYRDHDPVKIAAFEQSTVGGFHEEGPPVRCTFVVRQPEAAWVKRNLLRGMKHEVTPDGIRVSIDTAAVHVVARFVVQLGEAARTETPELAHRVTAIARGALKGADDRGLNSSPDRNRRDTIGEA